MFANCVHANIAIFFQVEHEEKMFHQFVANFALMLAARVKILKISKSSKN